MKQPVPVKRSSDRPVSLHSLFHGLDDPSGVGAFERNDAHQLTREVVDVLEEEDFLGLGVCVPVS